MTHLKTWLHQHKQLLFVLGGLFILAGPFGSVCYVRSNWPSQAPEQIVLVGVVATVAAAYLAFLAAVVALMAFIVADQTPNLGVELNDKPLTTGFELAVAEPLNVGRRIAGPAGIRIRLINTSSFSARNPIVRLRVNGALLSGFVSPWRREGPTGEDSIFIWEGGTNVSIHGYGMPYLLPEFGLAGGNSWAREAVTISIEVVAEGFRLPPRGVAVTVTNTP